jgi:hypothetical protein
MSILQEMEIGTEPFLNFILRISMEVPLNTLKTGLGIFYSKNMAACAVNAFTFTKLVLIILLFESSVLGGGVARAKDHLFFLVHCMSLLDESRIDIVVKNQHVS